MAGYKILIIEDEPIHLNVMKTKLENEGYDILVASDGAEGFRLMKEGGLNLVLLDIMLPKMNGFDVLEAAKKAGLKVPIIVVSNSGQPVEVDRAIKLGAKDYLVKAEFNPADVLEKVEKILGKPTGRINSASKISGPGPGPGPGAPPAGGQAASANILIVEDDKFLRDLIVQKLKREGFNVIEAIDGEEGLKTIKEKRPDLILLDLILPGIDGFEILSRLKADKASAAIPVIVLSNLGQKEDMDRAISNGAEDFMVKAHFTPGEIVTKIKSVLKKKYL